MGETIIEKIIRHNTGKAVRPGDIVTVNVDRCMIHDIFIPFVADKFEEMGFTPTEDPHEASVIVFNTCAVRRTAEEHVLGQLGALKGLKEENPENGYP